MRTIAPAAPHLTRRLIAVLPAGPASGARPSGPSPRPLQSVAPLPHQISRQISRGGYLESQALGVCLLLAALIAIGCWAMIAWRRRGRRLLPQVPRVLVNAAIGLLSALLLLAGIAVLINSYAGYVPSVGAIAAPPDVTPITLRHPATPGPVDDRSRIVDLKIPGRGYGMPNGQTFVYLPPGYDDPANANRRYPTVYLIHGYPGRAADWINAGQAQQTMDLLLRHHYVGPMILVAPTASSAFTNDDECLNSTGHLRVEDYLTFAVPDAIDHTFRTLAGRNERAIGGMSSGGFCALNIGLHHPHRFSIILASEPYGDPGRAAMHRMLGSDPALYAINSPSAFIDRWSFPLPVDVFLDAGSEDAHTTSASLGLARSIAAHGQIVAYRAVGGLGHNWREARASLPYALIFGWQHFGTMRNGGSDRADAEHVAQIYNYYRSHEPPSSQTPRSPRPSPGGPSTRSTPASPQPAPPSTPTPGSSPLLSPPPGRSTTRPQATVFHALPQSSA